jgi:phosphoglycerate dehydrogenase-like enzyme
MANVLILLTLPEPIRDQYRDRLHKCFPAITLELVDHHSKVGPYINKADAFITFAPMLSREVLAAARRLKWVQALGTGVDNLIDQPALRKDVTVTNMRGIHGAPVSEAALAARLALARGGRSARKTNGNGAAFRRSFCTTRRLAYLASGRLPKFWRRNARPSACAWLV